MKQSYYSVTMMRKLLMTILLLNPKISSGKPRIATSNKYPDITYEDAKSPSHLNTIDDNDPTLTIKDLPDDSTSVAGRRKCLMK